MQLYPYLELRGLGNLRIYRACMIYNSDLLNITGGEKPDFYLANQEYFETISLPDELRMVLPLPAVQKYCKELGVVLTSRYSLIRLINLDLVAFGAEDASRYKKFLEMYLQDDQITKKLLIETDHDILRPKNTSKYVTVSSAKALFDPKDIVYTTYNGYLRALVATKDLKIPSKHFIKSLKHKPAVYFYYNQQELEEYNRLVEEGYVLAGRCVNKKPNSNVTLKINKVPISVSLWSLVKEAKIGSICCEYLLLKPSWKQELFKHRARFCRISFDQALFYGSADVVAEEIEYLGLNPVDALSALKEILEARGLG